MKRVSFLGAGAFALAPFAAALSQQLTTIRVAGPNQEGFKVAYYGVRSGLFRNAGLNVEIVTVQNGAAGLAALAGGSVDVVITSMLPFFQAYGRGLPFVIVAPSQLYLSDAPTQAILVKKDSPIRRAADMNGKIVGVPSIKDLNWGGAAAWIDKNGGDSSTVKFIELPLTSVVPALTEGRIDVGTLSAPYLEQAIASGQVRSVGNYFDAIAKRFEVAVYISTKSFVDANHAAMVRFGKAMHDSAIWVNTHTAESIQLISSFTGIDPAVVAKGVRTRDPDYVDVRDIQPVLDLSFKYKLIDHQINANDLIASTALRPPRN